MIAAITNFTERPPNTQAQSTVQLSASPASQYVIFDALLSLQGYTVPLPRKMKHRFFLRSGEKPLNV
jgi:hypothetical protein